MVRSRTIWSASSAISGLHTSLMPLRTLALRVARERRGAGGQRRVGQGDRSDGSFRGANETFGDREMTFSGAGAHLQPPLVAVDLGLIRAALLVFAGVLLLMVPRVRSRRRRSKCCARAARGTFFLQAHQVIRRGCPRVLESPPRSRTAGDSIGRRTDKCRGPAGTPQRVARSHGALRSVAVRGHRPDGVPMASPRVFRVASRTRRAHGRRGARPRPESRAPLPRRTRRALRILGTRAPSPPSRSPSRHHLPRLV